MQIATNIAKIILILTETNFKMPKIVSVINRFN